MNGKTNIFVRNMSYAYVISVLLDEKNYRFSSFHLFFYFHLECDRYFHDIDIFSSQQ